jgi:hypothetical protein
MSGGNFQKTPLVSSLNQFATAKAQDAIQQLGKALPCSVVSVQGAIITVKFEVQSGFTLPQVTVPLFGPEYIRYPIQSGDKGVVFAADAYLGGMSGLGGGVADLTPRNNLTTLVFFPIGNKNWQAVDPQSVVIYGPNGVVIETKDQSISLTLTPSGIVIQGNVTIQGSLAVTGSVIAGSGGADQVGLQTHVHLNTQASTTSTSGTPKPSS